ncbi:MAG: hypothetical protein ACKV2T_30490 [Kofleriaceae bacterium]
MLLYLVLAIVGWFALWLVLFVYSTSLCPNCGSELESRFSFLRGQGTYCARCSYER